MGPPLDVEPASGHIPLILFLLPRPKILASLVPPIVRHGGLRSPVAEVYAADQLLRARDQPRGNAERTEAEPAKVRHGLLAPCQLATPRDRHAWRVGAGARQEPHDGATAAVVGT